MKIQKIFDEHSKSTYFVVAEPGIEFVSDSDIDENVFLLDNQKRVHDGAWFRYGGLPTLVTPYAYHFHRHYEEHRINGPQHLATHVYYTMGRKHTGTSNWWYLYGYVIEPKDYFDWLDEMGVDINNISEADEVLIALEWNK